MTTVVYRDGVLAADSQLNDMNEAASATIIGTCEKVYELNSGALLGTAGDGDAREVIHILTDIGTRAQIDYLTKELLTGTETGFRGILVLPEDGSVWFIDIEYEKEEQRWTAGVMECLDDFCSVGSGSQAAMGAMHAGANAIDAVFAAIEVDPLSGGEVQYMEFTD